MNIHEYQAKELLRRYDVAVPNGCVAFTPEGAAQAARKLGGPIWVVKSQIHAGGRGAGRFAGDPSGKGGVRVVKSIDEVQANAAQMLGATLVTKQTGPAGREDRRRWTTDRAARGSTTWRTPAATPRPPGTSTRTCWACRWSTPR